MDLPTILIYNPDEEMAAMTASLLQSRGFEVAASSDPDEILPLFFHHQPDVVMVCAGEGPEDSFSLVNRLRAQPLTATTPVIMTSPVCPPQLEQQAKDLWCAYLKEPYDTGTLMETIEDALRNPSLSHPLTLP